MATRTSGGMKDMSEYPGAWTISSWILLAPHVWRFASFKLLSDELSNIIDVQTCFPQVQMPLLENWVVDMHGEDESEEMENTPKTNMLAEFSALSIPFRPRGADPEMCTIMFPRLRIAAFVAVPMDWKHFAPTNLQSLEISYLPKPAQCPSGEILCQILLANAHSLTTLKLHGAVPQSRAKEPYVMPNLEQLDLGYVHASELIPFVEDARLPNLECLAIDNLFPLYEVEHDHTSLFQALMVYLPLHRLRSLELRDISFIPDNSDDEPMQYIIELLPDPGNLLLPAVAFEFLCKLSSLKVLTLIRPDAAILNTLNYVPIGVMDGRSSPTNVPVPSLDILRLDYSRRIEDAEKELERAFLSTRFARRKFLLPINQIIFTKSEGWSSKEAQDWISEISRSIDVLCLAKRFEHLETESGFQVSLSSSIS
jgi:hypothetical protein